MKEESKHNIDELLNGYVDGELSERKYTELKRMMQHDPELAARFAGLKKQKQLLNSMPIEKAPQGLLDEVVGSLERKLILNEYSAASIESEGIQHLMFRRALTAAVILVLFGGLGGLIYKIVSPVQPTNKRMAVAPGFGSEDYVGGVIPLIEKNTNPIAADTPVFRATLNLKTEHAITMNSFLMKLVFTHNLNDFVEPPENEGTSSTIRFACGIDSIVDLLADLQTEWSQCRQASLSVYDHAQAKMIVIENLSSRQLMQVFTEDKFYTRMQIVKDHADFNGLNPRINTMLAVDEGAVKPGYASGTERKPKESLGGEKISLVITVTGL
jgi:hypothetical protein